MSPSSTLKNLSNFMSKKQPKRPPGHGPPYTRYACVNNTSSFSSKKDPKMITKSEQKVEQKKWKKGLLAFGPSHGQGGPRKPQPPIRGDCLVSSPTRKKEQNDLTFRKVAPRWRQDRPKGLQEYPKMATGCPKRALQTPQDGPRMPQESPADAPRWP